MSDTKNDGVVDGPGEPAEPTVDTDRVGPDGTIYDEDALDEAARKMGIEDDADDEQDSERGDASS